MMFESDMSWITPRYDEYNVIQKEGTAELRMYLKGYADQKNDLGERMELREAVSFVQYLCA